MSEKNASISFYCPEQPMDWDVEQFHTSKRESAGSFRACAPFPASETCKEQGSGLQFILYLKK
jgi:hypothetical protein